MGPEEYDPTDAGFRPASQLIKRNLPVSVSEHPGIGLLPPKWYLQKGMLWFEMPTSDCYG